jgi:hypothetical protein
MPRLANRLCLCSLELGFGIVCACAEHIGVTLTVAGVAKTSYERSLSEGKNTSGPRATDGLKNDRLLLWSTGFSVVTRPAIFR